MFADEAWVLTDVTPTEQMSLLFDRNLLPRGLSRSCDLAKYKGATLNLLGMRALYAVGDLHLCCSCRTPLSAKN